MDGNIDILDVELPKQLVAAGASASAAAPSSTSSADSSSMKTIRMKRISKLAEDLADPDVRVTSPSASASLSSDSLELEEKRYSASRSERASLSEVYGAFSLTKQPRAVLTTSPGPSSSGSGVAIPKSRSSGARSPSSPSIPAAEISVVRRTSALVEKSVSPEPSSRESSRYDKDKDEEGTRIDSLESLVESASARSRAKSSITERERRAASRDRAGLTKKTSGVEIPPVVSPAPIIVRKVSKARVSRPTSPEVESAESEGKDPKSPSASTSFSYTFSDEPSVAPSISSTATVKSSAAVPEVVDSEAARSTLKRMRKKILNESGYQTSKRGLAMFDDQDN